MSHLTAEVVRKRDPIPPSPPAFETAAASSAEVQVPMGARMMGTSIPYRSQSGVLSIAVPPDERRMGPTRWTNAGDLALSGQRPLHVRFGSKADMCCALADVR